MSFWEDASPAVKGVVVIGGLLIAYLGVARLVGFFPYGSQPEVQQTREIQPR